MPAPILIVGQGLAGTMLAWAFEQAGIEFEIVDAGHATAASRVGAGIINPITGMRLVKSWEIDTFLPAARAAYREVERILGITVMRPMRVRRLFAGDAERRTFDERAARGELQPFLGASDEAGFWIEGAARVDTAALVAASRARWLRRGFLREAHVDLADADRRRELVIACTGAGLLPAVSTAEAAGKGRSPWQRAKGEILAIATAGLEPGVILNRGHWLLPVGEGVAWVGATYDRAAADLAPTPAAREALSRSAAGLLGRSDFVVTEQLVGMRVTTPDRHPAAGRLAGSPGRGVVNGLGSKGALLAPGLARQWVHHLTEGVPFNPEVDVARFA